MSIRFIVEKTDTGYSAFAEEFNVATTAPSISELHRNALEAFNLLRAHQQLAPVSKEDLRFEWELSEFFQAYRIINVTTLASRIGKNQAVMSQYITGKRTISAKQREEVIDKLRELLKEMSLLDFR